MATVGGDLATLADLYNRFTRAASDTEALKTSVNTGVENAVWTGPNAVKFKTAWDTFKATLLQIQEALNEGATDVKNQHNNIAAATGAGERI